MGGYALSRIGVGLNLFLDIITYAIIIRSLLSWFVSPFSGIMRLFVTLTEPFLAPLRAFLNRIFRSNGMSGFDFAPMLAILILWFLGGFVDAVFLRG